MGEVGAGCGLSRGFRLLNLYAPYAASLEGRAAEAADEVVDALGLLNAFCAPGRLGSLDLERRGGIDTPGLLPGERSNRSARALTLLAAGGERVAAADDDEAGPETDRVVGFEGERTRLAVGGRGREVAAMSAGGRGAISCSVVV